MAAFIAYNLAREVAERVYDETIPAGWELDTSFNSSDVENNAGGPGKLSLTNGFYAYALKPVGDQSGIRMLAFRGTEIGLGNINDIYTDAESIGQTQFADARGIVDQWLAANLVVGNNIELVGHSLGGALAQWAINDTNKNSVTGISVQVSETIRLNPTDQQFATQLHFTTFNAPGISSSPLVLRADDKTTVVDGEHHVIAGFMPIVHGDPVHLIGGPHVGGDVYGHYVPFQSFSEGLLAHSIGNADWWNTYADSSYQPDYLNNDIAHLIASNFSRLANTDGTVEGDREAILRLTLFTVAAIGTQAAQGIGGKISKLGDAFGMLGDNEIDTVALANAMTSGTNGFNAGVKWLLEKASVVIPDQLGEFAVRLIDGMGEAIVGYTVLNQAVWDHLRNSLIDIGKGLGNLYGDLVAKATDTIFTFDKFFGFSDYAKQQQAIEALLNGSSINSGLQSALQEMLQKMEAAGQTIILQPGRSDANPFDGDLSALDTNTVDVGQIGEGHYKAFTLYLPYAAGPEGLTIRLTLNGTAANKFVLLDDAAQTELGSDGVFEIYIAPGERQAGFGLWAKAQVGNAETLGLAAQLIGSDGTPSHLGHLEINLDLSTANGTDGFDRIIAGDLTPIDTDPAQDGIQARHDDLENLIVDPSQEAAGREDILYDSTGHDKLQGLGGSDILHAKRGGDDRLEGGLDSDVLLGGAGNDELYANNYQDFETALAANDLQVDSTNKGDLLDGGEGDDIAVGFEGRDALVGGAGDDILMGGGGDDILSGDETVNTQYMSNIGYWKIDRQIDAEGDLTSYRRIYQNLITEQKSGDDILLGGSGDDWLLGGAGQDWLDGGAGNDVAFGEAGDDQITGGDGNDVLSGDTIDNLADPAGSLPGILHGDDYLDGGAGDDTLAGNGGNDQLFGGTGNDDISGDDIRTPGQYHGADTLNGEEGNDNLWGNGGNDELYGGSGNDHLEGDYSTLAGQYHGNDYLEGGEGDDILIGEGKDDTLYGGEGNDELVGDDTPDGLLAAESHGKDLLDGGAGNDILIGGGNDDTLLGGEGDDQINGDGQTVVMGGNDFIDGGNGNDRLAGNGGNDEIHGGDGDDSLAGQEGNDTLIGGTGTDAMDGGEGDDTYILNAGDSPTDINGFNEGILDTQGRNTLQFNGIDTSGIALYTSIDGLYFVLDYTADDRLVLRLDAADSYTYTFADGQRLSLAQLVGRVIPDLMTGIYASGRTYMMGGAIDNTLQSTGGNAVISGGQGADTLLGSGGNNTYRYGVGDGTDHLTDTSKQDGYSAPNTLAFGPGITQDQITLGLGSLMIRVGDNPDDIIHIEGFDPADPLNPDNIAIDRFTFDDGTELSYAQLLERGFDLDGTEGDDSISGTALTDRIAGGQGNDTLTGGQGNDTYIYRQGDGTDTVLDSGGIDTVQLADYLPGDLQITKNYRDITLTFADGGSLTLTGIMTPEGVFTDQAIETLQFADGTTWDTQTLIDAATFVPPPGQTLYGEDTDETITAGDGDDTVYAGYGNDEVHGGLGNDTLNGTDGYDRDPNWIDEGTQYPANDNDTLYGEAGDDTLDGGYRADHDTLIGGTGDDTYIMRHGAGNDTIIEQSGVDSIFIEATPDQLHLTRNATDLILQLKGDSANGIEPATITVQGYYTNPDARIESIQFNDAPQEAPSGGGTTLNQTEIETLANSATDGDDWIAGTAGNDQLQGLGGNDQLHGGEGDDTYLYAPGDGLDTIADDLGNNTLQLQNIDPADLRTVRLGDDLIVLAGSNRDRITIANWYTDPAARLAATFDNGTTLTADELEALVNNDPTEGGDYLPGTTGNDVLEGQGGDDILLGLDGNDTLNGGAGNDELQGGLGDDTYIYTSGEGADTLIDAGGWDTLQLADLLPEDVQLMFEGNDLLVSLNDGTELRIAGGYANPDSALEAMVFADGTMWGVDEITAYTFRKPTVGGDSITGTVRDDRIDGLGGGDYVSGGEGDDTYYFGRDYGTLRVDDRALSTGDTLTFKDGIVPDDLAITRSSSDLMIAVQGGSGYDQVYISNYFDGNRIERFVFADGTELSYQDLDKLIAPPPATTEGADAIYATGRDEVIDGLGGDDRLDGYSGNDTLSGGTGIDRLYGGEGGDTLTGGTNSVSDTQQETNWNVVGDYSYYNYRADYLNGGAGDDTYLINTGDGYDQIEDASGSDRIVLGAGLSVENIVISAGNSYHLGMFRIDYGTGTVHVYGSYLSSPIERIESADGQVILGSELGNYVLKTVTGTTGGDVLNGGVGPQSISAGDGSDVVHAGAGRDALNGDAGDDVLYGDSGDDTVSDMSGYNYLSGGAGNDTLSGIGILDGGAGNDTLSASAGSMVLFGRGDGTDTIGSSSGFIVALKPGIAPQDVVLRGKLLAGFGGRITLSLVDGDETLIGVENASEIRFADGTVWTQDELQARSTVASGTPGVDTLAGSGDDDVLDGGDGNDTLAGGAGNDLLIGGAGIDWLNGNAGDDTLDGGAGSEMLRGEAGRDVYRFGRGYGYDVIQDPDLTAVGQTETVIEMAADIVPADVSLIWSGGDMILGLGAEDQLTVSGWLSKPEGSGALLVRFADGTEWRDADLLAMHIPLATDSADYLNGDVGSNLIDGAGGNDIVNGLDGADILVGGDGNDAVSGGDGNDMLIGGSGNDQLAGGNGDDILDGGSGDDTLDGGSGADVYRFGFGSGKDRISGSDSPSDMIELGAGVGPNDLTIALSGSNLVITLQGGSDVLTVSNWVYNKVGRLRFADGSEINLLNRPEGPLMATEVGDTISASEAPPYNDYIYGLGGNDWLEGGFGDDHISGGAGNDTLVGGSGADVLDGGAGNDTYRLSSDDRNYDEIVFGFDSGQDLIQQASSPFGATAPKIVRFESNVLPSDILISAMSITSQAGTSGTPNESFTGTLAIGLKGSTAKLSGLIIERDATTGGATVPTMFVFADGTTWSSLEILTRLQSLAATSGGDGLAGGTGADNLAGLAGNDVLVGGGGNDVLDGGAGLDALFGGAGDDVLTGSTEADTLLGGAGNDVLEGNAGDDRLLGGTGTNIYRFGGNWGADTVYLTSSATEIIEFDSTVSPYGVQLAYSGSQLVISVPGTTNKVTVTGNPDEIRFADGTVWQLPDIWDRTRTATAGADSIGGSSLDERLDGLAGNDKISGGAGNDWLFGGEGDDGLSGDAGDDRLDGGAGNDALAGGIGSDWYVFGQGYGQDAILDAGYAGIDTVEMVGIAWEDVTFSRTDDAVVLSVNDTADQLTIYTSADGALGVERIRFADGTVINPMDGSVRNDTLAWPTGGGTVVINGVMHDTLELPAGVLPTDVQVSRSGSDLLVSSGGNGVVFRNWYGSGGALAVLQVVFADGTLWSAAEMSALGLEVAGSASSETLAGLKMYSNVLHGADGNDRLVGGNGADVLDGAGGNDILEGGLGNDTMSGGAGDDMYYVETVGDMVSEAPGEGNDTVRSAIAYTLGENVENLELLGGLAINGTGNAGDNRLTGNSAVNTLTGGAGNDVIDGGAGADSMVGGTGDDAYYVDNSADSVIENAGEGVDTVNASITYTLSANLEHLTLTGTAAVNGTGNAGDNRLAGNAANNTLTGNAGNDILDGGAGNDTLVGGAGDDTYYVDSASDVVTEAAGAGVDAVIATATYSIASYANVENLTLAGDAAINATGNTAANRITGNAAANTLNAGAGDDILEGGAGNDILQGGQGSDTYVFGAGSGLDTIIESSGPTGALDKIVMAAGVTSADMILRWKGNDLIVSHRNSADRITVQNFKVAGGEIEEIRFSNGTSMTYAQIVAAANAMPTDNAPVVSVPLADSSAYVGQAFELVLDQGAFSDADTGDALAFSAMQADGTVLPTWLKFDASTRRFYGQPVIGDIGLYSIKVVVGDSGNLTVSDIFTLNVGHAYDTSPIVLNAATDLTVVQHQPLDFSLPQNMFFDADPGDVLTLSARMADGQALPSWLKFDSANRRFTGTPPTEATGSLSIAVSATDSRGRVATDAFVMSISEVNDAPRVSSLVPDQILKQGDMVSVQLPAGMFVDPEGDPLSIGVTLANGDPLPGWLHYDAATGIISGQTATDAVGVTSVRVSATDPSGLMASDTFDIAVADTNDAPVVANPLADLSLTEGQSFKFTVPSSTFIDPDRGDLLTYGMQLVSAPAHSRAAFGFNSATREISANALGYWDIGVWTFKVSATDRLGVTTEDSFTVTVDPAAIDHAPVIAKSATPWGELAPNLASITRVVEPGDRISVSIPLTSPVEKASDYAGLKFIDLDAGDVLTYGISPVSGVIPNWSFNAATGILSFDYTGSQRNTGWRVTAIDSSGLSVGYDLNVVVNSSPVTTEVTSSTGTPVIAEIVIYEDQVSSFTLPSDAFVDPEGDVLQISGSTLSETTSNGSRTWTEYSSQANTYTFTPHDRTVGTFNLTLTAKDPYLSSDKTFGSTTGALVGQASGILRVTVLNTYDAPILTSSLIADRTVTENQSVSISTSSAFQELDPGEKLTYSATLSNGEPLPSWLSINSATGVISGIPRAFDVGASSITVTATDRFGAYVADTFDLTVNLAPGNHVPVLMSPLADQVYRQGQVFSFQLPGDAFYDIDASDSLTYSATLESGQALPAWMQFNASTRTFSGTVPSGQLVPTQVKVTAKDTQNATVSDVFSIAVDLTNQPPIVANPLTAQVVLEDQPYTYTIPAGTFVDPDSSVPLAYSASLADGSALPSWVSFDASTRTFTGQPGNDQVGAMQIKVTATDNKGESVSDYFQLNVQNVNDAPIAVGMVAPQNAAEDAFFSFVVPAGVFDDIDAGDRLSYSAVLVDGASLPAWLVFDASALTFTGMPSNADVGTLSVRIVATDQSGAQASRDFALAVANTNDAPTVQGDVFHLSEDTPLVLESASLLSNDSDMDPTADLLTVSSVGNAIHGTVGMGADGKVTFAPDADYHGIASFDYVAADGRGGYATATATLQIDPVNDAPILVHALPDVLTMEDQPFSVVLPGDAFDDVDGDVLTYAISMADGTPLPDWISFDTTNRTLSGLPANGDVGQLSLRVAATDTAGASIGTLLNLQVGNTNDAPVLAQPLPDAAAIEDAQFLYALPVGTFADVDAGDVLTYEALLEDGSPLPQWLSFDAATATFSGTPGNGDVGTIALRVMVADQSGASAAAMLHLSVNNVNDAPVLVTQPADQTATEDTLYSFALPTDTFGDIDAGDVLVYAATLANGDALPDWLVFDAATATFSGTPGNGDVGRLQLQVTVTDTVGAQVSAMFSLSVENVNDAPVAQGDAIVINEDTPVAIAQSALVGNDSDIDPTADALVVMSVGNGMHGSVAMGEDGAIHFTPDADFHGAASFDYTISDGNGGYASSTVSVQVDPINDAPMITGTLVDVVAVEDLAFSATLPADAFGDIDTGDSLSYTATLADGGALPSWLSFDAATRTFTGTPGNGDVGALSIAVTAADLAGAQASQIFSLQVANTNDAPVANTAMADQVANEDAPFSLVLPADLFADVDVGDSLTYSAMLADGTALPSWLAFDQATSTFSGTPGNGDVGDLNVSLMATDSAGATATQSFAIRVLNVNDLPVAVADTAEVAEDGTLEAVGNVLANDTDIDVGDRLSIAGAGTYQGNYGQLTLDADGQYRYLLDNAAAQALGEGVLAVEHFAYAVTDGAANVDGTLDVTITGRNDAPVLAAPLDPVAITVGSAFSWTLPTGAFTDADAGDTLAYGLVQEDGSALPSWLSFDVATRTLTGTPATTDTGALRLALVAMDGSGAWAGGLLEIDIAAPQGHGEVIVGTPAADTLVGTAYDDVLDGQGSVDTLAGGNGNDLYLIDANHHDRDDDDDGHCEGDGWHDDSFHGDDRDQSAVTDMVVETADGGYDTVWSSADYTLTANVESLLLLGGQNLAGTGNGSNNLLVGSRGNNDLDGLSGDDLLLGGLGNDYLSGGDGLDALDGGYGNDTLEDGAGNGFVAGGRGNDTIRLQGGADVIAFNRGDGKDTVEGGDGRNDILSLGGGIKLGDLKLGKEGKDLVVDTGRGDTIRLTNWYAGGNRQTVSTLQIAHADDASRFDRYNFAALVADFDNSRKSANTAKQWSVATVAPRYSLADTQPMGGELAARYAQNGDLEQVHPDTVTTALSSPAAAPAEVDSADADGSSPSGGDAASQPVGDNYLPDDSPDYWSQLDSPVTEDTWDTAPMMADVAADWLHYAEQNGYDTVSSGDARIDYAVTWARLRDELSGLLDEDRGGGDGHWMFSHDGRGMWLNATGANGGYGTQVNLPGNLLKQFEGLKEGMDKLHG